MRFGQLYGILHINMADLLKKSTPEAPRPEGPRPLEVEAAPEAPHEAGPEVQPPGPEVAPPVAAQPLAAAPSLALPAKDPDLVVIENILSEGLADLYRAMPPEIREKFKIEGEVVAGKIKQMIASAKVQAKKILALIRDWLRIIPSVNRFFLEQESKIKTDKILALVEQKKDTL